MLQRLMDTNICEHYKDRKQNIDETKPTLINNNNDNNTNNNNKLLMR